MDHNQRSTDPQTGQQPVAPYGATWQDGAQAESRFRRRVLVTCAVVSAFIAVWLALWLASDVLLLTFAGILLAVFLRGLAETLSQYSALSDTWALAIVLVALVALLGGTGWYLAPEVNAQVQQLGEELPEQVAQLQERTEQIAGGRYVIEQLHVDRIMEQPQLLTGATGVARVTLNVVFGLLIVTFIGVYAAYDPKIYTRGIQHLVPHEYRDRYRELVANLYVTLWRWLMGRLMECVFVGTFTALGLWFIGVPLALTLGIIAGVLNFIPNIGPLIAFVPAGLVAASQGMNVLLWTAGLYLVVQSVESYVLTPNVQHRMVMVPPVLVLASQILFWVLFGFLGLFLATPIAAALLVTVKSLYVRPMIGDRVEIQGEAQAQRLRAEATAPH